MRFRGSLVVLIALVLILAVGSFAQSAPQTKPATPAPSAAPQQRPPATAPAQEPGAQQPPAAEPDKVASTAPVLTLQGACADAAKAGDCSTVVTKEQFEKLSVALDPNITQQGRNSLADQYAKVLVMAGEATKHGLADSPRAQEVLRYVRMQILANLYNQQLQEQAKNSSPEAMQKYYDAHQTDFQEVTLRRIVIPRNVPPDAKKLTDVELAALATDIDNRARAGEDFDALQKAAFDAEGLKNAPPPTSLGAQRRASFAPAHLAVISALKPGEVSNPMPDTAAFFIYKLESSRAIPLAQVQPDVQRALQTEGYQNALADVFASVKATLNPQYFGALSSITFPGRPQATPPAPSLNTVPTPAPRPPAAPAAKPPTQ